MACRLAVHLQFPVDPGAHGNVLDLASGAPGRWQGPLLLGREALTRNPKCDYTPLLEGGRGRSKKGRQGGRGRSEGQEGQAGGQRHEEGLEVEDAQLALRFRV